MTAGPLAAKIMDEAMALDDDRHYQVSVKPLEPAKGNFTFIKNIDFTSAVPVQTDGSDKKPAVAEGETPSEENEPAANEDEKRRDHDRVASVQPKVRTDPGQTNPNAQASNNSGDGTFMKSVKKFFRRDSDQETSQDLSAQQKNLQREKKRQQQSSQPNQQQQQTQDPPKRRKFLGIF